MYGENISEKSVHFIPVGRAGGFQHRGDAATHKQLAAAEDDNLMKPTCWWWEQPDPPPPLGWILSSWTGLVFLVPPLLILTLPICSAFKMTPNVISLLYFFILVLPFITHLIWLFPFISLLKYKWNTRRGRHGSAALWIAVRRHLLSVITTDINPPSLRVSNLALDKWKNKW